MPYGAHEAMETHEILMEKINMITHFNLYAREANNPQLKDMIARHLDEEIRGYNEIVHYTHDYTGMSPIPPNTEMTGVTPQSIQYGLNNPPQMAPQSDTKLSDQEIAVAMLCCHKNAARSASWASLECADPNLRQMLFNSAANCARQAYEVFLFMNEQGVYQVPTLNDHTAKTFLHRYQPTDQAGEGQFLGQAYGGQFGQQNTSYGGQIGQQNIGYGGQFGQANTGYGTQFGQQNAGFGMPFGQQNQGYGGQLGQQGAGFGGQFGQQSRGFAGQFGQQGAGFGGQFGQQNRSFAGQFGQQGVGMGGQVGQQSGGMAGATRGMSGQSAHGTQSFPSSNAAGSGSSATRGSFVNAVNSSLYGSDPVNANSSQSYGSASQSSAERSGSSSAQSWTDDANSADNDGSGSMPQ